MEPSKVCDGSDDDIGEVVHVKQPSPPPSNQNSPTTTNFHTTKPTVARTPKRTASRSSLDTAMASSTSSKEGSTSTPRLSRAKKGKRVHACNHPGCEKIFTRAEHLRRHQLNHNTDVYYKCEMCDRTFVRQDLLSRHRERHETQALKAVQTLAMAQRHRQFSAHYGINGLAALGASASQGEYGGSAHVFDSSTQVQNVHSTDVLPQILAVASPHASTNIVPPQVSMPGMGPVYASSMHLPHAGDPTLDFTSSESTPSPSANLGRPHIPFHLQHGEPQRQPEAYITSHADIIHRPSTVQVETSPIYSKSALPSYENNYNWLFDDSPERTMLDSNQNYMHPLDIAYNRQLAQSPLDGTTDYCSITGLVFHPMDERMRAEILMLVGNVPNIQASNFASLPSMQHYLRIFWQSFHPLYPLLHRPTFVPSLQAVWLTAIVIAIGASYADNDAHQFAMVLYDKIKALLVNFDDYPPNGHSNVAILQTLLLTDIFGKMRSSRDELDGAQLDMILSNILRRDGTPVDSLNRLRRIQREGLEYDADSEWHNWVNVESRRRISTIFFFWDVQQATMFGRELCRTAFELRFSMPSGKDEVLWESECASDWLNRVDCQFEHPKFLDILRIFFDQKRQLPVLSPLSSLFVLHGLISVALDLKQSRAYSPVNNSIDGEKQSRLLHAYERWKSHYEVNVAHHLRSPCHNKIMLMYHMSYITMHTNLYSLLTVAGDTRHFLRNGGRPDYYHAKNELHAWANSTAGQISTWHAVQALVRSLGDSQLAREQVHITWCMYMATLVCWTYGSLSNSANGVDSPGEVIWDAQQEMRLYFHQMSTQSWPELIHVRGQRRTTGLITCVRSSWEGIRWGLLERASDVLRALTTPRAIMKSV